MIECENCKYYDSDDNFCTWIACDGLDCDDPPCEEGQIDERKENDIIIAGRWCENFDGK